MWYPIYERTSAGVGHIVVIVSSCLFRQAFENDVATCRSASTPHKRATAQSTGTFCGSTLQRPTPAGRLPPRLSFNCEDKAISNCFAANRDQTTSTGEQAAVAASINNPISSPNQLRYAFSALQSRRLETGRLRTFIESQDALFCGTVCRPYRSQ